MLLAEDVHELATVAVAVRSVPSLDPCRPRLDKVTSESPGVGLDKVTPSTIQIESWIRSTRPTGYRSTDNELVL